MTKCGGMGDWLDDEDDDYAELGELIHDAQSQPRNPRTKSRGDTESVPYPAPYKDDNGVPAELTGEMWAVHGGKNFAPCERAVHTLPPGQYTIEASDRIGLYFSKTLTALDEVMVLPDSVSETVIKEVQHFWTLENKFREFGFIWKRGVLLWGPPGSGKTVTLQIISKMIVDLNGIAVYVDHPQLAAKGLKLLRRVEPTRPIVVMMEDIDSIIQQYGESELLAIMDGELQIDRVVYIATTNYPERLDKRFIARPSRFDIVKKIGMPSPAARTAYLKAKNPRIANDEKELEKWVGLTDGFSIAHLKEMIISVEVLENTLDFSAKKLRSMISNLPSSSNDGDGKFGFN